MADRDDDDDVPAGDDYLWDRSGPEDPEVARLERLMAPLAHDAPLALPDNVVPLAARRRWPIVAGVAALAAAAAIAIVVLRPHGGGGGGGGAGCDRGAGFAFSADSAVKCDRGAAAHGTLAVGGWIETTDGTARVEVANIGAVELAPRSRLALRDTSASEHRLALEHGALHAKVSAPPRLFVIETASATAIDLGCEYDLAVGPDGTGTLTVVTGQVELAAPSGVIVVVPAGTTARFTPHGVGLPVRTGANQVMIDAVTAFDPGKPETVEAIISAAGDGDQITLVNLLALAGPYQRDALFDALHALSPCPEDVVKDAIIAGDKDQLARWRESVVDGWMISPWSGREPPGEPRTLPPDKAAAWRGTVPVDAAPAAGDAPPDAPPVPPMPEDRARDPGGWGPQ